MQIQHKRIGSDAPNEVDEDRTEENEPPPPLPSLPVLLQRRAPLADIRRKLEEEPSCLLEKDLGVRVIVAYFIWLMLTTVMRSFQGQTPLHIACSIPNINVEVVKALITAGASVKDTDANGWTPLHCTCPLLAISHECKLTISSQLPAWRTRIKTSCGCSVRNLTRGLLKHKANQGCSVSSGADAAAPNADGTRPFHYLVCRKAIEYDRETIDQIRGSILCLLKGGADINQPNR